MSELLESVDKLTRDIKNAAITLGRDEARFLVDAYYQMQDNRIRATGQERSLVKEGEPNAVIGWLGEQNAVLENNVKRALDAYSKSSVVGLWSREIIGIGPVIAAGLMAHIDIEKAPTVGHIWRFAGLDPTCKWDKGQKRPWNAALKTLAWKIGESFVKVCNHEEAFYGRLYVERKAKEQAKNEAGEFATAAAEAMKAKKWGKDTDALQWYSGEWTRSAKLNPDATPDAPLKPRLPPAHIHARAKRYAVKLFLAHWHEVAYRDHYKTPPPKPYPIAILGHAHELRPPGIE